MGTLFRVEALAAAGAAASLCSRDDRRAWLVAGLVAPGGLVAVLTSRYADLPSFGPLPDGTDPTWFRDKLIAALAMAATCTAWAVRELLPGRPALMGREGAERRHASRAGQGRWSRRSCGVGGRARPRRTRGPAGDLHALLLRHRPRPRVRGRLASSSPTRTADHAAPAPSGRILVRPRRPREDPTGTPARRDLKGLVLIGDTVRGECPLALEPQRALVPPRRPADVRSPQAAGLWRPDIGTCGRPLLGHEVGAVPASIAGDRSGPWTSVGAASSGLPDRWLGQLALDGGRTGGSQGGSVVRGVQPLPPRPRARPLVGTGPRNGCSWGLFSSACSPHDLVSPDPVSRDADCCGHPRRDVVTMYS